MRKRNKNRSCYRLNVKITDGIKHCTLQERFFFFIWVSVMEVWLQFDYDVSIVHQWIEDYDIPAKYVKEQKEIV